MPASQLLLGRVPRAGLAALGALGANGGIFLGLFLLNQREQPPSGSETAAPSAPAFELLRIEEPPLPPEVTPEEPIKEPEDAPLVSAAPAPPTQALELSLPVLTTRATDGGRYLAPQPSPAAPTVTVLSAEQVDQPPRLKGRGTPEYPAGLKARRVAGKVTVRVLIDTFGRVNQVSVVDLTGHRAFGDAVTRAARSWRFVPARHRGQSVKVWARRTISFEPGAG